MCTRLSKNILICWRSRSQMFHLQFACRVRSQDIAWRDESIEGDPALDKDPLARAAQELLQDAGQDDDALLPAPSLDIAWPPG